MLTELEKISVYNFVLVFCVWFPKMILYFNPAFNLYTMMLLLYFFFYFLNNKKVG